MRKGVRLCSVIVCLLHIFTQQQTIQLRERGEGTAQRERKRGGGERTRALKRARFSSSGNVVETELKHVLPLRKEACNKSEWYLPYMKFVML